MVPLLRTSDTQPVATAAWPEAFIQMAS